MLLLEPHTSAATQGPHYVSLKNVASLTLLSHKSFCSSKSTVHYLKV